MRFGFRFVLRQGGRKVNVSFLLCLIMLLTIIHLFRRNCKLHYIRQKGDVGQSVIHKLVNHHEEYVINEHRNIWSIYFENKVPEKLQGVVQSYLEDLNKFR